MLVFEREIARACVQRSRCLELVVSAAAVAAAAHLRERIGDVGIVISRAAARMAGGYVTDGVPWEGSCG